MLVVDPNQKIPMVIPIFPWCLSTLGPCLQRQVLAQVAPALWESGPWNRPAFGGSDDFSHRPAVPLFPSVRLIMIDMGYSQIWMDG